MSSRKLSHTQVLNNIYLFSPWLDPKLKLDLKKTLEFLSEHKKPKRLAFADLKRGVESGFIVALLGLRRLGKTTLAKQFLAFRLKTDFKSCADSLYYQFNEQDNDVERVLSVYFSQISSSSPQRAKTTIILDEVQYCDNWQVVLKKYYDLNKKIEFVVTGSTSVYINEQIRESLAGRIVDVVVDPISFWEYVYLSRKLDFDTFVELKISEDDFLSPDRLVKKLQSRNMYVAGLQHEFYQYAIDGEYPQILLEKPSFDSENYLRNLILNRILRKDIELFDVRNNQVIELLFTSIAQDTSSIFNVNNLSAELGVALNTLKKYLLVLEKSFLIRSTENYYTSVRSRRAAQKKFFAKSLNLAITATRSRGMVAASFKSGYKGKLIETYVHNRLNTIFSEKVFFKRRRQAEVDIWLQVSRLGSIPIEVKSREYFKSSDISQLRTELKSARAKWGVLTSFADRIEYSHHQGLVYAPVWLW